MTEAALSFRMTGRTFWRQTRALTICNLKARYRNTWAGFLWVVAHPMIMFGVQSIIFKHILKLEMTNYLLFLFSGLVPWIFIVQSAEMCAPLITNNARILKSLPIHPFVYVGAQVLDNSLNFLVSFLLILCFILTFTNVHPLQILLLPIPLIILTVFVTAMSWFLATLNTFFYDTKFVVGFAFQVGFYLTPIFYPEKFLPASLQWILLLNPLAAIINLFRAVVYDASFANFFPALGHASAVTLLMVALSIWFWNKKRSEVYFVI